MRTFFIVYFVLLNLVRFIRHYLHSYLTLGCSDGYGNYSTFKAAEGIVINPFHSNLLYIGDSDAIRQLNLTKSLNQVTTIIATSGQTVFFGVVIDTLANYLYVGSNVYNCIYRIDLNLKQYIIYAGILGLLFLVLVVCYQFLISFNY